MKRILAIILVAVMALAAFSACSGETKNNGDEDKKGEGVMTHAEYIAAEKDAAVVIETYVQAKQSWWEDKATLYTQDKDGAYFIYNASCSQELYDKLVAGTKIKVTGFKGEYSGEIEIAEGATIEIEEAEPYLAPVFDATALFGTDELEKHMNEFFTVKDAVVEAIGQDDDGNDLAFFYNYNNSGEDGNDLYFKVKIGENSFTFTVESYLCDNTTEVYNAVKNLKVGDVIDIEGFLYWYEGANPHVTSVVVK